MERTENLGLHQWDADDAFLREEFNEDFLKLDEALRCKTGSFMGDGQANRVINLGIKPKLIVFMGWYRPSSQTYSCLFFLKKGALSVLQNGNLVFSTPPGGYAELTESGFRLVGAGLNATDYENHYIAFY